MIIIIMRRFILFSGNFQIQKLKVLIL